MSIREKALQGVIWTGLARWGEQGMSLGIFLILARLLEPSDFGIVAMASVLIGFMQVFQDQGLPQAIIQREELDREHLDTAFWVSLGFGSLLAAVGISMAGMVALFYGESRLESLLLWLSLVFVLQALGNIQESIFKRNLEFKKLAFCTLLSRLVGGGAGVVAAFWGLGVWSLVIQNLGNVIIRTCLLWIISSWYPAWRFSGRRFLELFGYGINIVGLKCTIFLSTRLDDFLIGFFLGAEALGYYSVAYRVMQMMRDLLSNIIAQVVFPTFSRLQQNRDRLLRVFYKSVQYAALVAFPAFLGLSFLAQDLVPALFGTRWAPSAPVMQVLALVGFIQCVLLFNGDLVLALGRPGWILRIQLFATVAMAAGFMVTVKWGIVAVSISYAVVSYLMVPLHLWMTHRVINIDFRTYFSQYAVAAISSTVMLLVLWGLDFFLGNWGWVHGRLAVSILVGVVTYIVAVAIGWPLVLKEMIDIIRVARSRKNG